MSLINGFKLLENQLKTELEINKFIQLPRNKPELIMKMLLNKQSILKIYLMIHNVVFVSALSVYQLKAVTTDIKMVIHVIHIFVTCVLTIISHNNLYAQSVVKNN